MQRYHYRAQCLEGGVPERLFREALPALRTRMEECGASQLSLFRCGSQLFLYYESMVEQVDPHTLFKAVEGSLAAWPGEDTPRRWVPMADIFHYQRPVGWKHWTRSNPAAKPYARVARLKPELAASYVFYHYQYQEERPGEGDKYGIITLHENWMFFYSETPATVEPPPYSGRLSTSNTPSDWAAVMAPHFIQWEEDRSPNPFWMEIPLVIQA